VIALGVRIWMAYGVLGLTTALLCTSVPTITDAQSAAQPPAVTGRNWPTERPPRPLPAKPVTFPPYEIKKLSNGLQVVLVSHHEQPAVSVRMIMRAGAAQDPKGKMGLAMLTASLLDQGAGSRTAEQIADTIDFVGGILGTGAGTDLTYINTVVMNDSFALGLQLMADVVRRPTFDPQEVERQRQQAMSGLKVAAEDPDNVASQVIERLIYGFHPYGLPGSGTAESLAGLTRQDIVEFHQRYYAPNNALIAIVGDVAPDVAMAGLEKAFGDWQPHDVPPFKPIDPPAAAKRVVVIDKPDAVQTEIRVGQLGIPRRHNDFLAMDQAVKILGGEGANRLQQVLRSQRGLTYGASADLQAYKTTGGIVAETDTRTEATAEALRLTVDEFSRLQRERVYEGELEGAQAYLAGHFPLTIETPDAIATQVLNQLFYDLPLDELQTFPERVRSVTPDDVQRVARGYFHPDRLAVVLVGNADAFVKDLRGVGFGEFERIPIGQVDLLAADLRKGRNRVGAVGPGFSPADPVGPGVGPGFSPAKTAWHSAGLQNTAYSEQTVADPRIPTASADAAKEVAGILKKAVDAHGGRDALLKVERLVAEGETTLVTPDGEVKATTRTAIEYPERIRVDADLPDAQIVQVYADGKGWLKDPAGVHDAPQPMLAELRTAARRDPLALLRAAASGSLKARMQPDATVEGRELKVVAVDVLDSSATQLFFDAKTGELVKMAFHVQRPGDLRATEERYDDYRSVDGIRLPFKASIVRGQVVVLERSLTSVTINPTLAPDTFARPAR
jgi:zinc protease